MSIRTALLFSLAVFPAQTALAQSYDHDFATVVDDHEGNGYGEWRGNYRHGDVSAASHSVRLGYNPTQRAQWLADCRLVMGGGYYDAGYSEERRGPDGRVVGGVLGAVVGGIAGNRIADDNRIFGTVLGAGAGAVVGSAIGDAIDDEDYRGYYNGGYAPHKDEIYAARYCEAYLRNYENSGGFGYSQTAMIPAAGAAYRNKPDCTETIVEEWVDVPESRARRVIPRRPSPVETKGKLVPVK